MEKWRTVIGLEIHAELLTKTKIFCNCSAEFGGAPNTRCCPVCTGMPGTLPIINQQAVEYAVKAGYALNCGINKFSVFDRKNYFYPDLPKAYQISQLYRPIVGPGYVPIEVNGQKKNIRINHIHLEEDAGKLVHDAFNGISMADYNRCGIPLIEIVTEPDIASAEEAMAFVEQISLLLQYAGVCDCKMEQGSLRCDVNISLMRPDATEFGTRAEIKNINSIKSVGRAIKYEEKRQALLLEAGKKVVQETRRYNANRDKTTSMRTKENANDYRYFPEPDILQVNLTDAQLMGVNINRTISLTFAIGSGLAAIAGALLCSAYPTLQNTTGAMPGIKAFVAAVFGGIGSIPGAMIGGILIGVIEILGRAYISPQLADAIVFAVLILVLIIKPTGILGKKISEKV